jgi:hypothetical protein
MALDDYIRNPTWQNNVAAVAADALEKYEATPRLLYWGTLSQSRDILEGDTPSFASGALTITED